MTEKNDLFEMPTFEEWLGLPRFDIPKAVSGSKPMTKEELLAEIARLKAEINAAVEKIKSVQLLKDGDQITEELYYDPESQASKEDL